MNLLIKAQDFEEGYLAIANPDNSPLQELDFGRLRLRRGSEPYIEQTGGQEVVLTLLTGSADVEIQSPKVSETYPNIGGRSNVFSQSPTLVYVPPESSYQVAAASSEVDILISRAPTTVVGQPVLMCPEEVGMRPVGAANWRRRVNLGFMEEGPTQRLMVGETINPPGNWSSYPPHKHDTDNPPQEITLEEVYFYLIQPPQGFGIQRLYERRDAPDALNEVYVVENGDTVILPRGYHPVVAAPGYQLYYFWALAGKEKLYGGWSDDPDHAWVRHVEPMLAGGV